ncbi:MAG TPA: type II toxin-antitoxin system HicB family antitoxin [Chloroflexota bacterium]|jgi:predicted RNase H-like HicB family nuclease
MLTTYIEAALGRATATQLAEDSTYFAEIPGFPGVWATAETLDECMEQLREVLEDWIVLQLRKDASLPDLDGMQLPKKSVPA